MTRGKLIGFGHKMRVGKGAACDVLRDAGFTELSFADPLRRFCMDLCGWRGTYEDFKSTYFPEFGYTGRELMQVIGTNIMRDCFDPNVWAISFKLRAEPYLADGINVCVSDVRFPNEVEAIHSMNGLAVKVVRDGVETSDHFSETALDGYTGWDHTLQNNGTLADLHKAVLEIAAHCPPSKKGGFDSLGFWEETKCISAEQKKIDPTLRALSGVHRGVWKGKK